MSFRLAYSFSFTQCQLSDCLKSFNFKETSDSSCLKGVESEGREDDGAQDTLSLSQHMAETEAVWETGRNKKVSDHLPLRQVIKASRERCLPTRGGKEHPYLRRQRDTEKNLSKQTLQSSLNLAHTHWHILFLHNCPLFIEPS